MSEENRKHALIGGAKPDLSLLPRVAMDYESRALEYGDDKYLRGNYFCPPPAGVNKAKHLLGYIAAAMRHLTSTTDAINRAIGTGGDVAAACASPDDEPGVGFPPSMLPHLALAMSSLAIGITRAVDDGLLPTDPGQPWKQHPGYPEVIERRGGIVDAVPQKANPDGEKLRALATGSPPEHRCQATYHADSLETRCSLGERSHKGSNAQGLLLHRDARGRDWFGKSTGTTTNYSKDGLP